MDRRVPYETPAVTDYGPIWAHTFGNPGGGKDWRVCDTDPMWGEYSCPDGS